MHPRIDLSVPKFVVREDPKAYVAWEEHCDYMFGVHHLSYAQFVKLASIEFYGYALIWWNEVQENQLVLGRDHINTWAKMKQEMQRRFVPSNYHHTKQQRSQEIDDHPSQNSSKAASRYFVQ